MLLSRLRDAIERLLGQAGAGPFLLPACAGLALLGTVTAGFPVTAVIVPAVLLAPARWKAIAVVSALGSAAGATLLVVVMHHMGWAALYAHYPQLAGHPDWLRVQRWVEDYGSLGLFALAVSPLPQTPGLIFFGISRPHYVAVFLAMLAGKLVKYGAFAYAARRLPQRPGRDGSSTAPPRKPMR